MTIAISPGEAIQITVDANATTAESPVISAFADQGGDVGPSRILTTGITPAVITTGPTNLGSAARVISSISVYNADTVTHTYNFQYVDASSALYTILKALVPNGWTLSYENGAGWRLVDNDGNFRETVFAYQAGTWTVAVSNFPALQAVNLTQVANSTLTSPSNYGTAPTGTVIGVNSFVTNPISQGVAAALAGAWPVEVTDGTNVLGVTAHPLRTDPTGTTTQPVSGTVTTSPPANASTNVTQFGGNAVVTGTGVSGIGIPRVTVASDSSHPVSQGTAAALAGAWPVEVTDGTNVLGTATHALRIDPTGTTTQPVSVSNFPGVQTVNLTQVASSTLTSPSNYGTAPTGTVVGVNAFVTNAVAVTGTFWQATQPISGTVTANAGTGTFTVSDSNFVTQGSATSGQKGLLLQGAVTTSDPSYITTQTSPVSLNTSGQLRVTLDGAALPTGANTIGAVTQASGPWSQNITQVAGTTIATPTAYGTAPSSGNVLAVNANVTNTVASEPATMVLSSNAVITNASHQFGATATFGKLRFCKIDLVGYVNSSSNVISIQDGGGTNLFQFNIPAITSAITVYNAFFSDMLAQPIANTSGGIQAVGTSNPTSGAIYVQVGASN